MTLEPTDLRFRALDADVKQMKEAIKSSIPILAGNQDYFARELQKLHLGIIALVSEIEKVKLFVGMPSSGEPQAPVAKPLDN